MGDTWKSRFQEVYERGAHAWREGRRSPQSMFDAEDAAFLKSIGCTAQELFDFVDDAQSTGEPDFKSVLAVQEIRLDHFLNDMGGEWPAHAVPVSSLPAKRDQVDGIPWLPRIIEKARLKLQGRMPAELMYGCGGDHSFLRQVNMTLPQFLQLVRDKGSDDRAIVEVVKASAKPGKPDVRPALSNERSRR